MTTQPLNYMVRSICIVFESAIAASCTKLIPNHS
jgi:hypothetical protein